MTTDGAALAEGIADTLTGVRRVISLQPLSIGGVPYLYALCSDGTMWEIKGGDKDWRSIKRVPQP